MHRMSKDDRELHRSIAAQRYLSMLNEFSWQAVDPADPEYANEEAKMAAMAHRQADTFLGAERAIRMPSAKARGRRAGGRTARRAK